MGEVENWREEERKRLQAELASRPVRRVTVELPEEIAARVDEIARRCTTSEDRHQTSHGPLTLESLLVMLAEDTALIVSPDQWGAHREMKRVLAAHGYEV